MANTNNPYLNINSLSDNLLGIGSSSTLTVSGGGGSGTGNIYSHGGLGQAVWPGINSLWNVPEEIPEEIKAYKLDLETHDTVKRLYNLLCSKDKL